MIKYFALLATAFTCLSFANYGEDSARITGRYMIPNDYEEGRFSSILINKKSFSFVKICQFDDDGKNLILRAYAYTKSTHVINEILGEDQAEGTIKLEKKLLRTARDKSKRFTCKLEMAAGEYTFKKTSRNLEICDSSECIDWYLM